MDDNDLAARANRLKDMSALCPGWKDILAIVASMRSDAFTEWSNLPMDASLEKTMSIKATEKVLSLFLSKIEDAVKEGEEAGLHLSQAHEATKSEGRERVEMGGVADDELARLQAPLTNLAITPQGAAA